MSYFRSPRLLILLVIIFIGIFFRIYNLTELAGFGHDEDLAAWIVKDIIIDHHPRLIGQETSIDGVFIGPLFYYLQIPFFLFFNLHPLSAQGLTLAISVGTVISIFFALSKLFNKEVGLAGSFIYASTLGVAMLDRWTVPTQPTLLWSIWYLYTLFNLLQGNLKVLPILAILIGLIWHVHVAFIPLLLLIPIAIILSRNTPHDLLSKITPKKITLSVALLLLLISPYALFELRHNFSQTQGFTSALSAERGEAKGWKRAKKVLFSFTQSTATLITHNNLLTNPAQQLIAVPAIYLGLILFSHQFRLLSRPQLILISIWIILNLLGQLVSKRAVSEYYFNNLFTLLVLLISVTVARIKRGLGLYPVLILALVYLGVNLWWLSNLPPPDHTKFQPKQDAVDFIAQHAKQQGYPCIAINFITLPGVTGGYRYLFFWHRVNLITPGPDVPIYNIVIPSSWSSSELSASFGPIGIILPKSSATDLRTCTNSSRRILDPWGFTTK